MTLSSHLTILLTDSLHAMHQHIAHHLLPYQRLQIYTALGNDLDLSGHRLTEVMTRPPIKLSQGHKTYATLAVATASYVLPMWEQAIPEILQIDETVDVEVPFQLLTMSEQVLHNTPEAQVQGLALLRNAHEWLGAIAYGIPYTALWAAEAMYKALCATLGASPFMNMATITPTLLDDDLDWSQGDMAMNAMDAFSSCSPFEPIPEGYVLNPHNHMYLCLRKRRSFWEWWLTEAIPEAWERAHSI